MLLFPAIIRRKKAKVLATIIHPYAAALNRYRVRGGGARSSQPSYVAQRTQLVYACNVTSNPAKQFSRVSPKFLFVYRGGLATPPPFPKTADSISRNSCFSTSFGARMFTVVAAAPSFNFAYFNRLMNGTIPDFR